MGKRRMILEEYRGEIEKYCIENDLSIEKLFSSGYGENYESAVIQYVDPNYESPIKGVCVIGGPPAPVTLAIYLQDDGTLRFEQTEITRKYLGNDACAEVSEMMAGMA